MALTKLLNVNNRNGASFDEGVVRDPVVRVDGKRSVLSFNFDINGLENNRLKYSLPNPPEVLQDGDLLRLYSANSGSMILGYQKLDPADRRVLKSVSLKEEYGFFPVD